MRFRVTSIADADVGGRISDATNAIENWLNGSLADARFGDSPDCLMFVVFASEAARMNTRSRLSSSSLDAAGKRIRMLALHVAVDPVAIRSRSAPQLLSHISSQISEQLPERLSRTPKGCDYPRLRAAIHAALVAYA